MRLWLAIACARLLTLLTARGPASLSRSDTATDSLALPFRFCVSFESRKRARHRTRGLTLCAEPGCGDKFPRWLASVAYARLAGTVLRVASLSAADWVCAARIEVAAIESTVGRRPETSAAVDSGREPAAAMGWRDKRPSIRVSDILPVNCSLGRSSQKEEELVDEIRQSLVGPGSRVRPLSLPRTLSKRRLGQTWAHRDPSRTTKPRRRATTRRFSPTANLPSTRVALSAALTVARKNQNELTSSCTPPTVLGIAD